jgi:hypothetical protein
MYPKHHIELDLNPRVFFGGKNCKEPYYNSILHVLAISFVEKED